MSGCFSGVIGKLVGKNKETNTRYKRSAYVYLINLNVSDRSKTESGFLYNLSYYRPSQPIQPQLDL